MHKICVRLHSGLVNVIVLVFFMSAAVSAGAAEAGGTFIEVGPFYSIPTGDAGKSIENIFGVSVKVGIPTSNNVSLGAGFSYLTTKPKETGIEDHSYTSSWYSSYYIIAHPDEIKAQKYDLFFRYNFDSESTLKPFFLSEIGYMDVSVTYPDIKKYVKDKYGSSIANSATYSTAGQRSAGGMCLGIGGGFNYYLTRNVTFTPEAKLMIGFGDLDELNTFELGAKLGYHF